MPSEPTEPMEAAPPALEAVALAPVAVPVPDESVVVAVWLALDGLPVVAVASLPVAVVESVVGRRETENEVEPELDAVALAEVQDLPALMAEQKAEAAGRTSSALVINIMA